MLIVPIPGPHIMKGHQYLHNGATLLWSDAFSFSYIDEWALEKPQKNRNNENDSHFEDCKCQEY